MRMLVLGFVLLSAAVAGAQSPARGSAARPDFSGYWGPGRAARPDPAIVKTLSPNTVVLSDAGATEFPIGEFGGLRVKPAALEAALTWKPLDDMTISRACLPPSIIYAMQGPFPMEIYHGTEFIIFKLEYFDLVRIIFMDGRRHPGPDAPHTKVGHSIGRWEGTTLVVDTTHLSSSTITNNGLDHSDQVRVTERFWLSEDGNTLFSLQEFEDPQVLDNRGARFMAWGNVPGEHIFPYECDPSFGANYVSPPGEPATQQQ